MSIDTWPEAEQGHTAVAASVLEEFDVGGWWSQGITVGWERITGRRLVNQMSDAPSRFGDENDRNRRATISIAHEKLSEPADVEQWKPYWTDWLEALDEREGAVLNWPSTGGCAASAPIGSHPRWATTWPAPRRSDRERRGSGDCSAC